MFVSAPTGAGKSLTFELKRRICLNGDQANSYSIVLVVVSLISLMKDQVSNLNSRGIPASYVGDDCSEQQLQDILNFKVKVIFGSPEAILNSGGDSQQLSPHFSSTEKQFKMHLHRRKSLYS